MEEVRKIFEIIEDMCLNGNCTYCTFRSNEREGGCMFKDAVGCNPEAFKAIICRKIRKTGG